MKNSILILFIFISQIIFAQAQRWDTAFVSTNAPDNDVLAICSNDSVVFIGGKFTNTAGLTTNYIAKWDGFNWQIIDNTLNGEVYSLAIVNGNLVAGGNFTLSGTTSLNHLGIFNGTSWSTIGTGVNGTVYTIEIHDQYIYFGGLFSDVDGNTTSNIAGYDVSTNTWVTFPNGPDDVVYTIDYKINLYAGGAFLNCGATATAYAATYQAGVWSELSSAINDTVRAIESDNQNQIFIGGDFTQNATIPNNYIARYDGTTWKDALGFDKEVFSLYFADTSMFAGGNFDYAGPKPCKRIGEWTGTGWNNLSGGMDSTVLSLTMMKRDLYLGGRFSLANINESINFARWGALPLILAEPSSTSICEGENLSLSFTIETSVPETYQWFFNGVAVQDSTNSTFVFNNADASWSGDYFCEISNQFGITTSSTFNIEIVEPVTLNYQISDTISCSGYDISLYVSASGTNPVYHWYKDGTQLAWANDSSLSLTNVSALDNGTYYCEISNMCDTIVSANIILSVNDLPIVSFTGLAIEYCSSDSVDTLTGVPSGGIFSGNGITDSLFNPNSLSGTQNITYTYIDNFGCSNSSVQSTNVKVAFGISFSGLESYYCLENNTDTLTPNPTGGTFSGAGISDSIFNPTIAGVGTHNIFYQWTNTNGCISYYSEETTIENPSISLGTDTFLCLGDTITLVATGDSGTYIWNTGSTNDSIIVWPNDTSEYSVILQSVGGCFRYDTIIVNVLALPVVTIDSLESFYCLYSDNDTLSASPTGGIFFGNGITDSIFNPQSAGVGNHTISYQYTDIYGCTNTTSSTTDVEEAVYGGVYFTGLEMEYCFYHEGVNLFGVPQGGIFSGEGVVDSTFYPNQTSGPGIYYVEYVVPNDTNCGNMFSLPVKIIDFPELNMPNDTSVCRGQTVNFIASGDEGVYTWNTSHVGDTLTATIYIESSYTVTLTTDNCYISDTVHVSLSTPQQIIINDTTLCRLDTVFAPDGFNYYKWDYNTDEGQELVVMETGSYTISVVDSFGCANDTSIQITMKPSPLIGFDDSYVLYQGAAIILGATSGYDEYLWSDGYTGYLQIFYGDSMTVGQHTYWLYTRIGDCELSDTTVFDVKTAISVTDPQNKYGISIYPNPASKYLQIDSKKQRLETIEIVDINGKIVKQIKINNLFNKTIDISDIEKGIYFVIINKENTNRIKFVKN